MDWDFENEPLVLKILNRVGKKTMIRDLMIII
jgi:hypothetical protein